MKWISIVLILFLPCLLSAQELDSLQGYIQFSGKIVQLENSKPIQGVRLTNLNRSTMAFSNADGVFTIVVAPKDTIQLSHIGMQHEYVTIPDQQMSKMYREFSLSIDEQEIEQVLINGLPPLDKLEETLMALHIEDDVNRRLAMENPDTFNILDTIMAHEPSLLAIKNGQIESSPISWFYERVYKKIKEKLPKPKRKEVLPKFKTKEGITN